MTMLPARVALATQRRRRRQPRHGRPAGQPQTHPGTPNRAERRAYVRRTCGFPNLFAHQLPATGQLPAWIAAE